MSKELIELNKRMKKQIIGDDESEITKLREQVAAQAAVIESLNESLQAVLRGCQAAYVIGDFKALKSIREVADEALTIPTNSTQILDEVRRAERERCAKVCESLFDPDDDTCEEAEQCAAAIRAME